MQDFKCVTETMKEIMDSLDEIQWLLWSAYTRASVLQNQMADHNNWEGEAQRAALAFMDLIVQYHRALSEPIGGPVCKASAELQRYLDNDSVFYEEWEEYQNIRTI